MSGFLDEDNSGRQIVNGWRKGGLTRRGRILDCRSNHPVMFREMPALLSDLVVEPRATEWNATLLREALPFVLTVLIEWPLLAWWSGLGLRRTGVFCLLMNGMSWGLAIGLLVLGLVPLGVLEAGVIALEGVMLAVFFQWTALRALAVSAGMNLASWGIGVRVMQAIVSRS